MKIKAILLTAAAVFAAWWAIQPHNTTHDVSNIGHFFQAAAGALGRVLHAIGARG